MEFSINEKGLNELTKRRKENNKLFLIFPIFFLIYMFISYISMRGTMFFWGTLPIFIILYLTIGIYAPILAAKRFNKVITCLNFVDSKIKVRTEKVNFRAGKEFYAENIDFKIIESKSIYYGNGSAEGLILRINANEEYYLIKDFFEEFDKIKIKLVT